MFDRVCAYLSPPKTGLAYDAPEDDGNWGLPWIAVYPEWRPGPAPALAGLYVRGRDQFLKPRPRYKFHPSRPGKSPVASASSCGHNLMAKNSAIQNGLR